MLSTASPTLTSPAAATVNENASVTFSTGNSNVISLVDTAAVANSDTLALSVSTGTLTLGSTTGLTFTSGTNNAAAMTIWGTLANLNAALSGLTYTPSVNYAGSDSLVLTAENTNNNLTGSANIAITVNGPPTVTVPTTGSVTENSSLTFSAANFNAINVADTVVPGYFDTVTLTVTHGILALGYTGRSLTLEYTAGSNRSATMTFSGALADLKDALSVLTYTPSANYVGSDSLAILVSNYHDSLSASANVDLTVGLTLTSPAAATVNENASLTFSTGNSNAISLVDVAATGSSDTLTLTATHGTLTLGSTTGLTFTSGANGSATMAVNGTLANLNAAINGLTFRPSANYVGSDSLTVLVADSADGLSTSASVALTIGLTLTSPAVATVNENASLTFSTGNSNAISLADPLASGTSDSVTLSVTHGSLTLGSTTGLTFTTGANGSALMTINGTLTNLNAALSGLVYTPTTGYWGSDSLAIKIADSGDGLTALINVALTVNALPAVIAPATASVNENSSLTFSAANANAIVVVDFAATAGSDSVKLTVTHGKITLGSTPGLTFSAGSNGAATMTVFGTEDHLSDALNGLTYTPSANYIGSDSLAILLTNHDDKLTASANVALTVGLTLTSPAAATVNENTSLTFSTAHSNAINVVDSAATGTSDSLTLRVTHGSLSLGSTTGLTFTTGANGSTLMTINGTLTNLNAALSGLVYTPKTGYLGSDALEVKIADSGDGLTVSANVTIKVIAFPILPKVTAPTTATVNENASLTFSTGNGNAISVADVEAVASSDTLKLTATHGTLTLGSTTGLKFTSGTNGSASMTIWGTLANINADLNSLVFMPTTGYFGSASLALTATNTREDLTNSANVTLLVNAPPVVTAPATANVNENSTLTFSTGNSNAIIISDLAATAGSDTVTLTVRHGKLTLFSTTGIRFSSGVNGAATMTFYGTVTNLNAALSGLKYTPTTDYSGPDTLAITIKNAHDNLSVSASVAITV